MVTDNLSSTRYSIQEEREERHKRKKNDPGGGGGAYGDLDTPLSRRSSNNNHPVTFTLIPLADMLTLCISKAGNHQSITFRSALHFSAAGSSFEIQTAGQL